MFSEYFTGSPAHFILEPPRTMRFWLQLVFRWLPLVAYLVAVQFASQTSRSFSCVRDEVAAVRVASLSQLS